MTPQSHPSDSRFVLVPREPTPEMMRAAERAGFDPDVHHETIIARLYEAMVSAAPGGEGGAVAWRYRFITSTDGKEWSDWIYEDDRSDIIEHTDQVIEPLFTAPPEPVAWRSGDEAPVVERGGVKSFVVAVFRAHSGQNYTFAAEYLNAMELDWEEDNDTRMATKTGWFLEIGEDQDFYRPVTLGKGDKFLGWTDLPRWPDAILALTAPSPKGKPDA